MPAPTTPPSITAVPTPPIQRNDRATFSDRVDAFITWLVDAVTEFGALGDNVFDNATDAYDSSVAAAASASNASTSADNAAASAATAVTGASTNATSSSSLSISLGSKSLTIETGKNLVQGMFVIIADTAVNGNYMHGYITSYNSGSGALVVQVTEKVGSGTKSSWVVSISSPGGATLDANTFTGTQVVASQALTSVSNSIAVDLSLSNNFTHTFTQNTTLASPSNVTVGQTGTITFTQGVTPRTLAFNTFWKFSFGDIPAVTPVANAVDVFAYIVDSAGSATCRLIRDRK